MRLVVFIVAILIGGGPAVAQSWREYSYPDLFFAVAFPSNPQTPGTKPPPTARSKRTSTRSTKRTPCSR
jgi:hypothetical protein